MEPSFAVELTTWLFAAAGWHDPAHGAPDLGQGLSREVHRSAALGLSPAFLTRGRTRTLRGTVAVVSRRVCSDRVGQDAGELIVSEGHGIGPHAAAR
jgi:hypothetical protein